MDSERAAELLRTERLRIEQAAGLGEILVSSTVRDMLLGGDYRFTNRGEHQLKGVEGTWKLYALGS